MQKAKYQEIAGALENGIRNGEYRGRLPSVRLLGELFGVNPRTVLRALQQLTAGGLIVPNGNRGFLIPEEGSRRPVSGNIVIFHPGPVSDNPGQLDRLIAQAGMRPISISTPAADLCGVRSFWETLSADGVIFMNSSLDRESAYQLKLSGIPFVAANRMPREWGVNCVEFDHESALRLFLKALIRRGRRRIALLNPRYPLHYFREIIFSAYFEVMNAYAIFDPELFVYPDESQPYEAALAAGVERLLALPRRRMRSTAPCRNRNCAGFWPNTASRCRRRWSAVSPGFSRNPRRTAANRAWSTATTGCANRCGSCCNW